LRFQVAYHTDIGREKSTNQDSLGVLEANTDEGRLLLAVLCDGMGGLDHIQQKIPQCGSPLKTLDGQVDKVQLLRSRIYHDIIKVQKQFLLPKTHLLHRLQHIKNVLKHPEKGFPAQRIFQVFSQGEKPCQIVVQQKGASFLSDSKVQKSRYPLLVDLVILSLIQLLPLLAFYNQLHCPRLFYKSDLIHCYTPYALPSGFRAGCHPAPAPAE